ncbi:MAG: type II secretion system F family protein [Fimbriimonadaceae bacterium]
MTTFSYVAVEPSGKKRKGYIEAPDQAAAIRQVQASGAAVLEIGAEKTASQTKGPGGGKKVSKSDLALFSRRMADMAAAGLPLDRVLQIVAEQSESAALAEVVEQALVDVRGGMQVSQALAKHPKYFPEVYTQTLRAGEMSGQFSEVASRLADLQEREVARRSAVISALVYPCVLTTVAVGVVIFLLTFVVPRLSGVFEDLGDDLPATTKLLLATTGALTTYWYIVVGALVGIVVLYRLWIATDAGLLTRDRILLNMPVVGKILSKATISRYGRVLSTLVFGGVPILDALNLSGLAAGNREIKRASDEVQEEVRDGRQIADAMRDAGAFPPVLTHMVAIGEETGDLPKMLGRVADSLDFEVEIGLRRATAMVEPIILLAMGAFVGFVVLSVMLPIFQAQELVK